MCSQSDSVRWHVVSRSEASERCRLTSGLDPDLVLKSKTAKSIQNLLKSSEDASMQICRVCLDEAEDPVMSKCRHVYCRGTLILCFGCTD